MTAPTWNEIENRAPNSRVTVALWNEILENMDYLASSPNQQLRDNNAAANLSTTSATFVNVDSTRFKVTFEVSTNNSLYYFSFGFNLSIGTIGSGLALDLALNGSRIGGGTNGLATFVPASATTVQTVGVTYLKVLSAGTYTIEPMWRAPSGNTMTLVGADMAAMTVWEL